MSLPLLLEQTLNGFQLGMTLFLMASGLTLTFGIMGLINLAHRLLGGAVFHNQISAGEWRGESMVNQDHPLLSSSRPSHPFELQ